jgi:hypothetical protein
MSETGEGRAIEGVVSRLAARFPTLARDHIAEVVREEQHRIDGGSVQDFVPVLAEHAARERLRAEADPTYAPTEETDAPAAEGPPLDQPIDLDPMEIERNSRRGGFLFGDIGGGPV